MFENLSILSMLAKIWFIYIHPTISFRPSNFFSPFGVGTSKSILSLFVWGQHLMMVVLSSISAWSISLDSRTLIFKFSRIKANKVVVKLTCNTFDLYFSWLLGYFVKIKKIRQIKISRIFTQKCTDQNYDFCI